MRKTLLALLLVLGFVLGLAAPVSADTSSDSGYLTKTTFGAKYPGDWIQLTVGYHTPVTGIRSARWLQIKRVHRNSGDPGGQYVCRYEISYPYYQINYRSGDLPPAGYSLSRTLSTRWMERSRIPKVRCHMQIKLPLTTDPMLDLKTYLY